MSDYNYVNCFLKRKVHANNANNRNIRGPVRETPSLFLGNLLLSNKSEASLSNLIDFLQLHNSERIRAIALVGTSRDENLSSLAEYLRMPGLSLWPTRLGARFIRGLQYVAGYDLLQTRIALADDTDILRCRSWALFNSPVQVRFPFTYFQAYT